MKKLGNIESAMAHAFRADLETKTRPLMRSCHSFLNSPTDRKNNGFPVHVTYVDYTRQTDRILFVWHQWPLIKSRSVLDLFRHD